MEPGKIDKILIKFVPKLISHFEAFELFQIILNQRLLKRNLRSKVQSISAFQMFYIDEYVVRSRPRAKAMESCEMWGNLRC